MLEIITGSPGSGKTLVTLQYYLLAALRRGRRVYHNIPGLDYLRISWYLGRDPKEVEKLLFFANVSEHVKPVPVVEKPFIVFGDQKIVPEESVKSEPVEFQDWIAHMPPFDDKKISYYAAIDKTPAQFLDWIEHMPPGSIGIIDEAQNVIGARDWQTPKNVKFFEYATVHRHYGHDVVLVTQHEDNIDVSVRRINNQLVQLRRLEYLGAFFRNSVSCRYYAGYQTAAHQPMYKVTRKYDSAIFRLYSSYSVEGVSEGKRTGTVWRNPKLIALFVVFFLCMLTVPNFLERTGFTKRSKQKAALAAQAAQKEVVKTPADFLGAYFDYFCASDGLYVLRSSGRVDTIPKRVVPAYVCPSVDYSPGRL
jgi:zona occludens toxin (predicted ATPase)